MGHVPKLGNMNIDLQLGTGFWIFMTMLLLIVFLWFKFGTAKLSEILTASFSPSTSTGRYVRSKN